ncbi:MAG: ATP-binding protein [Chloroflexi bacterium]|nr:ATP-binding protein [Chloroflexota bacterium]
MIQQDIDKIAEQDLQALIDNSVPEGKTVEYKRSLPNNSDADKKEFLADVSSFANASGGYLIYGMNAENGTPKLLEGLSGADADGEILRLESMIRSGIEPRISGVSLKSVPLTNSKIIVLVRVAKSWNSPHRVTYGSHDKFYSRGSNGKYALDVGELRVAFNLSETITDRIRNFRIDRISKILADEIQVPLSGSAKIILHLIPLVSFNPGQSYDLTIISSHPDTMPPIYALGWDNRYNLDGFLTNFRVQEGISSSYVQLFRNGIIEAVDTRLLRPYSGAGESLIIPSVAYEEELIKALTRYCSVLNKLGIEPYIWVFLTLVGVKGYKMGVRHRFVDDDYAIDRDVLQLPEATIETFDAKAESVLKLCFDSIWNACGFPKDPYYDEAGHWAPPK